MDSAANKKDRDINMLSGFPVSRVIQFSFPLIFANLFTQLYSIIDAVIVGKVLGAESFAAIGCSSWIIWILIALCRDSSNAVCTQASYIFGAKTEEKIPRLSIFSGIIGMLVAAFACMVVLIFIDPFLRLLHVDTQIYDQARSYLFIYTLSIPFLMINNMACALLRAKGNSLLPFLSTFSATIVNILLDLLFIQVLGFGVSGAAWATFIAQGVACVISIIGICINRVFLTSNKERPLSCLKEYSRPFFHLFLPMFSNSLLITVGGLFVQSSINAMGSYFTAGTSACIKIFDIMEAIIMAIMSGSIVFVGQNFGARNYPRLKKGVNQIVVFSTILMAVMVVLVWLFDNGIISLFLSQEQAADSFQVAKTHVHIITIGMLVMAPMYILRAAVQTIGYPKYPAIAGLFQLIARILCVTVLPLVIGVYAYYVTDVAAWIVTFPTVAIPFYNIINKKIRS